jgi:CDP-diglyceride synthetase
MNRRSTISKWQLWSLAVGGVFAVGGLAWCYALWRASYTRLAQAQQAGWYIDEYLPVFPRVLALGGLLVVVVSVLTILTKSLLARLKIPPA